MKPDLYAAAIVLCSAALASPPGCPFVNQAGYNLGEAKRFTCPGAQDGTAFAVRAAGSGAVVYKGSILGERGDFTAFNPAGATGEFVIEVPGKGKSVPFWVADHLMEKVSSRLAYQFYIDIRGGVDWRLSPANVTGGGPSRDGGGQGLEASFLGLLYASNPALFDRWRNELIWVGGHLVTRVAGSEPAVRGQAPTPQGNEAPDLLKLVAWNAEFAYHNRAYDGPTGGWAAMAEGYDSWVRQFGYTDDKLQKFDYQNLLDQLAAVHAFYPHFLTGVIDEKRHALYREACLKDWERYDRQKEVRHWVKSKKWIDVGRTEFNEQGNALGQGLLRNLLMYVGERQMADGQPDRFLKYAQECARDIIANWDFGKQFHTWGLRNGEHIGPQALAMFYLIAPEHAPEGTKEKLEAWRDYVFERTRNLWQYRTHSATEWAHTKSKEVGTVAGLGGSMFAVAGALGDAKLREIGWSQVNFVFGCNPAGAHLGNRSKEREALGGWWEGVERGWPFYFTWGTGMMAHTRGTLDGSPTNAAFPYNPARAAEGDSDGVYGTEGWSITNRGWLSTVAFSTLGSHRVRLLDPGAGKPVERVKAGQKVRIELKAALNQDWRRAESGFVLLEAGDGGERRVEVRETGPNTGLFVADVTAPAAAPGVLKASYGYLAFKKSAEVQVQR